MSPELQADTLENQTERPYLNGAREVIAEASKSAPETVDRFRASDEYVTQLLQDAEDGKVVGSAGVYTRDQLLKSINSFLKATKMPTDQRGDVDPYSYITSKKGLRSAFRLLMADGATGRDFEVSLSMHIEAHTQKRAELLSPANIQEMGEVEVSSAGIREPSSEAPTPVSSIIDGIPDHIKNPPRPAASMPVAEVPSLSAAEAAQRILGDAQPAAAQAEQAPETEEEMYKRFIRETKADLQRLYAEHRKVKPGSYEAYELERKIAFAKEDIGNYMRHRRS